MTPPHFVDCQLNIVCRDIGSQNATQGRETHALLKNAIAVQIPLQTRAKDFMTETHASLTAVKRQNEALGDFTADRVLAMSSSQRRIEDSTNSADNHLKTIDQQSKAILHKTTANAITHHNNLQDLKSSLKNSTLAAEHLSKQNHATTSLHLQQISNQLGSSFVNVRVNANQCDESRDSREIELDLRNFTDLQLFALYLFIRQGLGFIGNLFHMYPQLLLVLGLFQTVPASMSNLLSDNLTVLDVLDRKHSLPFEYFQDSGVFKAMLLSKFHETPGFEKIRDGEFSIVDSALGDKAFNLSDWSQVVRPRAKLVMTIHYSSLKLLKRQCVKCGGSMLKVKPYCWECPACSISFRVPYFKPGHEADIKSFEIAKTKPEHLLDHDLGLFKDPEDFQSHQRKLFNYRQSLLPRTLTSKPTLVKEINPQAFPSIVGLKEKADAGDSSEETFGASEDISNHMTLDLSTGTPVEASEWRTAFGSTLNEPDRGARSLEESQLQHFKRVRIEEESSVYRAALAGNYQIVQDILGRSLVIDESYGPWGSALTAAVISDSPKVVQLLLNFEYNPLLNDGPLGNSLRASALHGQTQILQLLIAAAQTGNFSHARSDKWGDALDSALLATSLHNRVSAAEILLFHGANPFSNPVGQPSAFLMAVYKKFRKLAEMFLVGAAERKLLSQQEFCHASSTILTSTPVDDLGIHDGGFKECCTELGESRGRSLQEWILRRLTGRYDLAQRSVHAPTAFAALEYRHYIKQLRSGSSGSNADPIYSRLYRWTSTRQTHEELAVTLRTERSEMARQRERRRAEESGFDTRTDSSWNSSNRPRVGPSIIIHRVRDTVE